MRQSKVRRPVRAERRLSCTALLALAVALGGCSGGGGSSPNGALDPGGEIPMTELPPGAGGAGAETPMGTAGTGEIPPETDPPTEIGFGTMPRLNRTQYNLTVRDLLGTEQAPATRFPPDELALGFDTIAKVLRVAPEHVDAYLAASRQLVTELLDRETTDPARQRYIDCDITSAECGATVIGKLATAAWRKPTTETELAPYLATLDAAVTPEKGLELALRGILVSPRFLYRIELDPNPDDPAIHPLSGPELASRLSYFLWSTMPDAELTAKAAAGGLGDRAGVLTELERMLGVQERMRTFVDTFAAQWLHIDKLQASTPDTSQFTDFDEPLRQAMIAESKEFFWDLMHSDAPISTLFTADFTYVNQRLAEHYELPGVTGEALQRVPLQGTPRIGLLTHGGLLTGMSNPTRTSPVKRGLYVLERLLCAAPPPPPPGIDTNIDQGSGLEDLPIRERLAQHQAKGAGCATCHQVIDTIGLGLENYDAVGRYRTSDEYGPIDATGVLPTASGERPFDGALDLAQILAEDPRTAPCVTEKLLTFGLGREFGARDEALKTRLATEAAAAGGSFQALLTAVVGSEAFLSRRAALPNEVNP